VPSIFLTLQMIIHPIELCNQFKNKISYWLTSKIRSNNSIAAALKMNTINFSTKSINKNYSPNKMMKTNSIKPDKYKWRSPQSLCHIYLLFTLLLIITINSLISYINNLNNNNKYSNKNHKCLINSCNYKWYN